MMLQPLLPVAVVALNLENDTPEDVDTILSRLPRKWSSLVVLPFGFPAVSDSAQELSRLARQYECHLIGGFEQEGKHVAAIFSPEGDCIGQYAQIHRLPGESFQQGNRLQPIDTPLGKIGLSIGSDIYFPETHWSLAQQGADFLVHLNGQAACYDHFYSVFSPQIRAFDINIPFLIARPSSRRLKIVHNEEFSIAGTPMVGSVILDQNGATLASTGYASGVATALLNFEQRSFPDEKMTNVVVYGGCDVWKLYFNDSRERFFSALRQPYAPKAKPAYSKRKIRVATISHNYATQLGHPQFLSLVEEACGYHPDIIVATEMESGCRPDDPRIAAAIESVLEKTRQIGSWLIIGGMRYPNDSNSDRKAPSRRGSTGVLWDREGRLVHKSTIMLYGYGDGQQVYDTDFGRLGIRLCGDVYAPELDRLFAMQGADIVFNPSMSWGTSGLINTMLNQVRAMDNGHYVVTVHLAFSDPGQRSHVIDPTGAVVAASPYYDGGVMVADIDLDAKRGIFVPDENQPVKKIEENAYLHSYRTGVAHRLLAHQELLQYRRPELYEGLDYDRPDHPYTTRHNGMNNLPV